MDFEILKRWGGLLICLCTLSVVIWSCSNTPTEPVNPGPPGGNNETVGAPETLTGSISPDVNETITYQGTGAFSSLGHPLEYRFDLDANGPHEFTDWDTQNTAVKTWSQPGSFDVRAEARCQIHPTVASGLSPALTVQVALVPMTQILAVHNEYTVNAATFVDTINFEDGIPDTVPFGSQTKIIFEGIDDGLNQTICADPINKCFLYQVLVSQRSAIHPNFDSIGQWAPTDPVDSDPNSAVQTMAISMGSLEYTLHARTTNAADRTDVNPPNFEIISNFDPTMDSFSIMDTNGQTVSDGGMVDLDWWSADSTVFLDGNELKKRKTFRLSVDATGHDHPKERDGSGVHEWFYTFQRVSDGGFEPFGRAGGWAQASFVNFLTDEILLVFEYPVADIAGDEIFVNNPPSWQGETLEFKIRGRDIPSNELFRQTVSFVGGSQTLNEYLTAASARQTQEGTISFDLRLVR